MKKRSR